MAAIGGTPDMRRGLSPATMPCCAGHEGHGAKTIPMEKYFMPNPTHRMTRLASDLHAELRDLGDAFGTLLVDTFHYLALFAIGATTVWSAVAAFLVMAH